jgi:hypothetical protein
MCNQSQITLQFRMTGLQLSVRFFTCAYYAKSQSAIHSEGDIGASQTDPFPIQSVRA